MYRGLYRTKSPNWCSNERATFHTGRITRRAHLELPEMRPQTVELVKQASSASRAKGFITCFSYHLALNVTNS